MSEISELMKRLVNNIPQEYYAKTAVVREIDEEQGTIIVEPIESPGFNEDSPNDFNFVKDVQLAVTFGNTNIVQYPILNSRVLIGFLSISDAFLIKSNDIYKTIIQINDFTFIGNEDGWSFNGGDNGGLINVTDLVTKVNNLEKKVNSLITKHNTHVHPYVNVTTPSVTSLTTSVVVGSLIETKRGDIEDIDVTH